MTDTARLGGTSRRHIITIGGIGALAAAGLPALAWAKPEDVAAEVKKLFGDKKPVEGKIKLEMPQIAENGNVVPLTATVESAMTDDDYVKTLHIFSEGNPLPFVATYYFTPACGKAQISTRMRMATTQNVVAVAETSKGEVLIGKVEVKVTIGGCGG